jgi:hypothetical protein
LSVQEGAIVLDGHEIAEGETVVVPPASGERAMSLTAPAAARVLRAVYGQGMGFVTGKGRR